MRKKILFPAALLLLVFSFVLSLCVGSAQISIREAVSALQNGSLTPDSRILFYVRLPRALAAVLSGAALAVSGVLLQNVLNNALAAPNIIGVNAGAGFAVLFLLAVFPTATAFLPFAAFLGALFASLLIYAVAAKSGASRTTITLAGVALSSVFTAGSNAIKTFFPDTIYNSSSFFIGGFPASRTKISPLRGLPSCLVCSLPCCFPAKWTFSPSAMRPRSRSACVCKEHAFSCS